MSSQREEDRTQVTSSLASGQIFQHFQITCDLIRKQRSFPNFFFVECEREEKKKVREERRKARHIQGDRQGKGEMEIIKNIYLTLVYIFILNHEFMYVGGAVMHM